MTIQEKYSYERKECKIKNPPNHGINAKTNIQFGLFRYASTTQAKEDKLQNLKLESISTLVRQITCYNFSCMFLNPNNFFQFEFELF